MGLLDQIIGNVVGQVLSGGRGQPQGGGQTAGGGGAASALSPIMTAILMALIAKGVSGGLGSILGGGTPQQVPQGGGPGAPRGGDGDLGGFGQAGGAFEGGGRSGGGQYGDLSGMLDGPGGDAGRTAGGVSGGGAPAHQGGGLDDLIGSFQQSGLGDVIGSWIGTGRNQEVAPGRLEDALGRGNIDAITRQTGIGRDELLGQLAQMLPQVIDALTPEGRAPSREERRGW